MVESSKFFRASALAATATPPALLQARSLLLWTTLATTTLVLDHTTISRVSALEVTDWADCKFVFKDKNDIHVEYNLAKFDRGLYPFEIEDSQGREFIYYFNMCAKISSDFYHNEAAEPKSDDTIPDACYHPSGPCITTKTDQSGQTTCSLYADIPSDDLPYALQVSSQKAADDRTGGVRQCWWLGAQLNVETMPNFNVSLLDGDNSAAGIVIEYLNGDWCERSARNRKLRIEFVCPDSGRYVVYRQDELVVEDEEVDEDPECVFTVRYESPLACPTQCITKHENSKPSAGHEDDELYGVCNGRGMCASDPNAETVRCLCDDGFGGPLCVLDKVEEHTVHESNEGLLTAIIICIFLLVLILGFAVYLCYRIKQREQSTQGRLNRHLFSPMLDDEVDAVNADMIGVSMEQTGGVAVIGSGGRSGGRSGVRGGVIGTMDGVKVANVADNDDDERLSSNESPPPRNDAEPSPPPAADDDDDNDNENDPRDKNDENDSGAMAVSYGNGTGSASKSSAAATEETVSADADSGDL